MPGIEPGLGGWKPPRRAPKARVLPLHYTRIVFVKIVKSWFVIFDFIDAFTPISWTSTFVGPLYIYGHVFPAYHKYSFSGIGKCGFLVLFQWLFLSPVMPLHIAQYAHNLTTK